VTANVVAMSERNSSDKGDTHATGDPIAPGGRIAGDAVIVGGGLVGLSLGHALARSGLDAIVVDREAPATRTDAGYDGRSSAIAYGSRCVLAGLGLWEHLAEHACPILDIRVSDGQSKLFLHYDHRQVGDEPLGHIIENTAIRRALSQQTGAARGLDGGRLVHIAPAEVRGLERRSGRVEAVLADGCRISASLAIAADGRQSPIRVGAGIGATEWAYQQTGIVCTVAHDRPHRNVAHERFLPAGPFALLPMTRLADHPQRSSIVWTERAALAPAMMKLDDAAFSAEMTRRFGDYLGPLRVIGRRWAYPLALLHAERYVAARLALVGDAAHAIHPIAGQGLNLGLRDVAALAEVIVDAHRLGLDIGNALVLERYERWRRFDSTALIAVTDALNRLFSTGAAPVRLARDLGLAVVDRLPPLKRLLMRHAMGVVGDLPRLVRGERL